MRLFCKNTAGSSHGVSVFRESGGGVCASPDDNELVVNSSPPLMQNVEEVLVYANIRGFFFNIKTVGSGK